MAVLGFPAHWPSSLAGQCPKRWLALRASLRSCLHRDSAALLPSSNSEWSCLRSLARLAGLQLPPRTGRQRNHWLERPIPHSRPDSWLRHSRDMVRLRLSWLLPDCHYSYSNFDSYSNCRSTPPYSARISPQDSVGSLDIENCWRSGMRLALDPKRKTCCPALTMKRSCTLWKSMWRSPTWRWIDDGVNAWSCSYDRSFVVYHALLGFFGERPMELFQLCPSQHPSADGSRCDSIRPAIPAARRNIEVKFRLPLLRRIAMCSIAVGNAAHKVDT